MKRVALFLVLGTIAALAVRTSATIPEQVKTDMGLVAGTASTGQPAVRAFKGIPFAAPPLGENRWREPQPAARWDGVRNADAFGAPCTAGPAAGRGGGRAARRAQPEPRCGSGTRRGAAAPAAPREPARSEDCLYLNVWTSAKSAGDRRPVMVWIYGGGFTGGSGGMAWYNGENLAAKGPVIVTLNYRLGSLGFFAHPELAKESGHNASGNYGMMDAIAALQWVKRNIGAFGGDPSNVTVAGESAGAIMVGALVGLAAGEGSVQPRHRRKRRLDGADDGPHAIGRGSPGRGRQDDGGAWRQDDRRAAREAAQRADWSFGGRPGGRRLSDSGRRVVDVHERQAERR